MSYAKKWLISESLWNELLILKTAVSLLPLSSVTTPKLSISFLLLLPNHTKYLPPSYKCWNVIIQSMLTAFSRMESLYVLSAAGFLLGTA